MHDYHFENHLQNNSTCLALLKTITSTILHANNLWRFHTVSNVFYNYLKINGFEMVVSC